MRPRTEQPPFYTHKQCMIDTYGEPLYRVPIDLGLGCPHRRADGTGGCTFCPPDGSRATYTRSADTIEEQVAAGLAFARRRYGARRFMAYVQAFTGTFAPVPRQQALYERILATHPFDALSVGTRPDCLPPAAVDLLCELRSRLDVWVELGVQTVHDATLRRIHRGHDWAASRRAALDLHDRGIKVVAHVIVGLPGEDARHVRRTADALARLPLRGIKIHNLHVVRGSGLEREFRVEPFPLYDEDAYADILVDFIRRLPPTVAIMRINTDTADERLVAPRWTMTKGAFRHHVEQVMIRRGVRQGDLVSAE